MFRNKLYQLYKK